MSRSTHAVSRRNHTNRARASSSRPAPWTRLARSRAARTCGEDAESTSVSCAMCATRARIRTTMVAGKARPCRRVAVAAPRPRTGRRTATNWRQSAAVRDITTSSVTALDRAGYTIGLPYTITRRPVRWPPARHRGRSSRRLGAVPAGHARAADQVQERRATPALARAVVQNLHNPTVALLIQRPHQDLYLGAIPWRSFQAVEW